MNRGKATGKIMQELLVAYGLERTIYRLSVSPYAENFTLKGGIFLIYDVGDIVQVYSGWLVGTVACRIVDRRFILFS